MITTHALDAVRVLYVEPDAEWAKTVQWYIQKKYARQVDVRVQSNRQQIRPELSRWHPDILLLADEDGGDDTWSCIAQARQTDPEIRIFIVSSCKSSSYIGKAFDSGADEYVSRRALMEEGMMRLGQMIRKRRAEHQARQVIRVGAGSVFDVAMQTLQVGDTVYHLPRMEARILELLCRNRNSVVPHQQLLACCSTEWDITVNSKDKSISRLRKCLRDDASVAITSIKTKGYVLHTAADWE